MNTQTSPSSKKFQLPEQGIFKPNGDEDPLPYYYSAIVGKIYRERIEQGLCLLDPPYDRILEIGFGSGLVLPSLCQMGKSVYGVDLNSNVQIVQDSLKRVNCSCTLSQSDINSAQFKQETFDLIVAFSILEHIPDLTLLVEQLQVHLKPGGHFLVGMPRVDLFMDKAFKIIGFNNIGDHHVSDYKQCLKACDQHFSLRQITWLPSIVPESFGLYYNMLFEKK